MTPSSIGPAAPGRLIRVKVPDQHGQTGMGITTRAVATANELWAFVPNPLPRELEIDPPTINQLAAAQDALGELRGIGRTLTNPYLLINPFLRREAFLSSRIEGTTASLQEVVLLEADPSAGPKDSDAQEVINYIAALHYGLERVQSLPVSKRLICELHEKLLAHGVRGEDKRPGEFRTVQNFIAQRGPQGREARFVPPPPLEVGPALDELERYLGDPPHLPFLIQLPLIHYQFETIHPFIDGNGRMGRLLLTLLLCERGALTQPLLYLSAYFERRRDDYMDHLLRLSRTGEWLPWVQFFLKGVEEQSKDAIQRSDQLFALNKRYRDKLQSARASSSAFQLVDHVFANPAITIPQAEEVLGTTYKGALTVIERLVGLEILVEHQKDRRPRLFYAPAILEILDSTSAK